MEGFSFIFTEMATLVMKIYSFAPVDRFSIIKWLTLKWLLENEFNLKWQNNASTLSTIEDLSIVQLKATDLFNLEFKGLECSCVFINFSNTSEPEYRINLTVNFTPPL